jgi:hypothetical protein
VYGLLAFVAAMPGAVVLAARALRKARVAAVARRLAVAEPRPALPQINAPQIAGSQIAGSQNSGSQNSGSQVGGDLVVVPAQRRRVLAHSGA